jgi:hypothetical protein
VKGGVATFEVTNKGQGWHPHLHALFDCEWLAIHTPKPKPFDSTAVIKQKCEFAQKELSSQWADMIGADQAIVWVRRAYGPEVISEVLKYAAKGSELIDSPDPIAPMLRVISATRTLTGFGSMHPLPSPDKEDGPLVVCESCGEAKSYLPDTIISFLCGPINSATAGRTVAPQNQR